MASFGWLARIAAWFRRSPMPVAPEPQAPQEPKEPEPAVSRRVDSSLELDVVVEPEGSPYDAPTRRVDANEIERLLEARANAKRSPPN